jgi:hypothetical protein
MSQFLYVHDCAASPVTTSAYTEIVPETEVSAGFVQFFYYKQDSSFGLVSLGVGPASEEVDQVVCSQKVGTPINVYIQQGSRLAIKAIGSNVSTGYIVICLLS